jgi:hypothetical protein
MFISTSLAHIRGSPPISSASYETLQFCFVLVLFAALLDHHSNMGPAEIPAKRRYTIQDTQRNPRRLMSALGQKAK